MSIAEALTNLPRVAVVTQEAMDAADTLDGAAAHIERVGWANNPTSYPRTCAVMAITAVILATSSSCFGAAEVARCERAYRALERFLGVDDVPAWNDAQASGDVVTDALRACAVALRSGLL